MAEEYKNNEEIKKDNIEESCYQNQIELTDAELEQAAGGVWSIRLEELQLAYHEGDRICNRTGLGGVVVKTGL